MVTDPTADLSAAHGEVAQLIATIPGAALDWQPSDDDWSLKRIAARVTHAYDFYLTIVEQARTQGFGMVRLTPDMPSWQRIVATDAEVARCEPTAAVLAYFTQAYEQAMAVVRGLSPEELDRPFTFVTWRPDAVAEPTTLSRRVPATAAKHLSEHRAHIATTLSAWQRAQQS
jgi:DinB superfamily